MHKHKIIQKKSQVIPPSWEKYYHLVAWGFPMSVIVVTFSLDSIAYKWGTTFCFIHYAYDIAGFGSLQYPIYYMPMGLYILISAFLQGLVIAKLLKHVYRTSLILQRRSGASKLVYETNTRIMLLCIVILFCFSWMWAYRLYIEVNTDPWTNYLYGWVGCR
jgi:hypothetical protein